MSQQEMPIFTRTFDFLTWLLPATNRFPRVQRHSFTRRLLDAALDLGQSRLRNPRATGTATANWQKDWGQKD